MNATKITKKYPKIRNPLPKEYKDIYNQHYMENREGKTKFSKLSQRMEGWLHYQVAKTSMPNGSTLEIGAGTLNQLKYEKTGKKWDIVEPFKELYISSPYFSKISDVYSDISEISLEVSYDRIIAIASFEHICNLPEVVERCTKLLNPKGIVCVSIPNEGRFLWKLAYTLTTGREFKKRFGLKYSVLMNYEHVNTADEIEAVLRQYFKNVNMKLLGIGKTFSFYRYYECANPF